MNQPEVTDPGPSISGLMRQAIAFVHDFAAFAGLSGIWAATLAVLGAILESFGLLLLVPILSIVTAADSDAGWTHRLLVFSRISAPAMQLSQMLQQFASAVPAHAGFLQLQRELEAHGVPDVRSAPVVVPGPIVFRDVSFQYDRSRLQRRHRAPQPEDRAGYFPWRERTDRSRQDDLRRPVDRIARTPFRRDRGRRHAAARRRSNHLAGPRQHVVQDPYLFRDTIRRNLLWAKPQASDAEIWDALAIAGVDDFVAGLPGGLDNVLGERGTLISGGERQRLCLARAVLRRPFLFVLDEATSAIDVPTEQRILKAMQDLKPRPTIVMIAHRDQSLAFCQRVLRLKNGRAIADEPALT